MKGALAFVGGLFLLWLIVWLLPSSAPPPVSSDAAGTVATASSTDSLLTPGRVLVLLLLAGGIGWAVYLRSRSDAPPSQAPLMHVVGRLALNPDQQLALVRCQDDVLLLGVSPGEITVLRTYGDGDFPDDADRLPAPAAADTSSVSQASLSGFADVLRQYTDSPRHA